MSIINCCAQAGLNNGDCQEPSGFVNMTGVPGPFYPDRESLSKDPAARALLWSESEKAVGKWYL